MSRKKVVKKLIAQGSEWTFPALEAFEKEIARIAESFRLDTYPNQIEIISTEQMMDAYSSTGMPLGYHHWSFGKQFLSTEQSYRRGHMGLAYELVINSNPAIAYLLEENTLTMQAMVIAHACFGHNSFFKGNYLFRTWTDASAIIDYLLFAKNFINQCEEQHGIAEVEQLLDSCHALMNFGVDRYRRPPAISAELERERQKEREYHLQKQVNDLWRTVPQKKQNKSDELERFPLEPQENLLYFIEKNAPLLEPWQREIVRIVRKIAQYFYPQRQTKVMNEGWATFWHYTILNKLYDEGLVDDGFILEALQSHTAVIYQPEYNSPYYNGINPYTLGYAMFTDIRRICEHPTAEDRSWFPEFAGSNWVDVLQHAMRNFKDESFILQFLSPKVIRDLKLFSVMDDEGSKDLLVNAIHNESGYQSIRSSLSDYYNLSKQEPNIQVYNVNLRGDRSLTLHHNRQNQIPLNDETEEVVKHIHRLWGFNVYLKSMQDDEVIKLYQATSHSSGLSEDKGKKRKPIW